MRDELIRTTVKALEKSFGKPRALVALAPLEKLHKGQQYDALIGEIAKIMRVNCNIRIGKVNSGGPSQASAWVERPDPIPAYGSPEFRRIWITVYVRKELLRRATAPLLIRAISHEFSHVVLDSIGHPHAEEETAVDLAAMYLGFRKFYLSTAEYEPGDSGKYLLEKEIVYANALMNFLEVE